MDSLTGKGAKLLKDKIETYWRLQGYRVTAQTIAIGVLPATGNAIFAVRSTLDHRGLPPGSGKSADAMPIRRPARKAAA